MISIYFLKSYKQYKSGDIIEVSKIEADSLISNGIARVAMTKDYLVRPAFAIGNVIGKAFRKSPKVK